jgi:uncharacterized protein (DUF736 family)
MSGGRILFSAQKKRRRKVPSAAVHILGGHRHPCLYRPSKIANARCPARCIAAHAVTHTHECASETKLRCWLLRAFAPSPSSPDCYSSSRPNNNKNERAIMQLGTFQKDQKTGGYIGAIRTLTSNVEPVRIVPREKKTDAHKDAPDYDVLGPSGSDFGAGWTMKRASDGIEYVSLRLYDPAFNNGQVLRPALWPRREGGFVMIHEPLDPNATVANDMAPTRPADLNGTGARKPAKESAAKPA